MKQITIEEIDQSIHYEGYYWLSNQDKPVLLQGHFNRALLTKLPFVIEAQFIDDKMNSFNIKNIDGQYMVHMENLSDLPSKQVTNQQLLVDNLKDIKTMKIIQFWEESQPDELLAGFTTLIPSWSAFAGFTK